jgi:hypothetical protein
MSRLTPFLAATLIAGCAGGLPFRRPAPPPDPGVPVVIDPGPEVIRPLPRPGAARPAGRTDALRPAGRTAAALDTTTDAERRAAVEAARRAEGQALGETLASLGNPGEAGLWLVTGLVDRVRPGRVVAPSGTALAVELRPSGGPAGGGSQASLGLMRALELPLAGLTTLRVFALD